MQRLESALGVTSPPGSLPLGSVVFEPEGIRVASVRGGLGGPAVGPVLTATSDRHVVTIPLSTAQESEVAVGTRSRSRCRTGPPRRGSLLGRQGGVRDGQQRDDPRDGDADAPVGGRNPGPGAGHGVHHHRQQPGSGARGAGGGVAGPVSPAGAGGMRSR